MPSRRTADRRGAALLLALAMLVLLAGVQQVAVAVALATSRRATSEEARLRRHVAQEVWLGRLERLLADRPAATLPSTLALARDTVVRHMQVSAQWAVFTVDLPDLPLRVVARRLPFPLPCAAVVAPLRGQGGGGVLPPPGPGCQGWHATALGEVDSLRHAMAEGLPHRMLPDTVELTSDPTARVHRAARVLRVSDGAAVSGVLVAPVIEIGTSARLIGVLMADSVRLGAGSQVLGDTAVAGSAWRAAVRYLPLRTGRLLAFP